MAVRKICFDTPKSSKVSSFPHSLRLQLFSSLSSFKDIFNSCYVHVCVWLSLSLSPILQISVSPSCQVSGDAREGFPPQIEFCLQDLAFSCTLLAASMKREVGVERGRTLSVNWIPLASRNRTSISFFIIIIISYFHLLRFIP